MEAVIYRVSEDVSWTGYAVRLDGIEHLNNVAAEIAANDGLTVEEFKRWFLFEKSSVEMRLIGWGTCPYSGYVFDSFSFLGFLDSLTPTSTLKIHEMSEKGQEMFHQALKSSLHDPQ